MNTLQSLSWSAPKLILPSEPQESSWISIDANNFSHNISNYKNLLPASTLLGIVLKSNAYGHGLIPMAYLAQINPMVDWLLVVSIEEALQLRSAGIQKPILVLSIVMGNIEEALLNSIALVAFDKECLRRIVTAAKKVQKKAVIHLKIDTGLSRLGTPTHQAAEFIYTAYSESFVSVQGIFTHLADSESDDHTFVNLQQKSFKEALSSCEHLRLNSLLIHSSCSAALGTVPSTHTSLARLGLGAYGLWPSVHTKKKIGMLAPSFSLKPVLTWQTRILQLKTVAPESFVGYDRTFKTTRGTTLAILPVGYWDGVDRRLSNTGSVLINNTLAPIVGRVAMNLTIVDVTTIPEITLNSIVTLLGENKGITADDHADLCSTISYEIVTRINPLLKRFVAETL